MPIYGPDPTTAVALTRTALQNNGALKGRSVTVGAFVGAVGVALQTGTGTSRRGYIAITACTDLRLVFCNWLNTGTLTSPNYKDIDNTTAVVFTASIEDAAGNIYRCTVGGNPTITMGASGGWVQTDPVPLTLNQGDIFYVRTFMTAAQSWYPTGLAQNSGNTTGSGGFVATTDLTGGGAVADSSFAYLFMPSIITGTHLDGTKPVLGIIGNSISQGAGDGGFGQPTTGVNITQPGLGSNGYLSRACRAAGIPVINAATSGDNLANFVQLPFSAPRRRFLSDATTIWGHDARNDISSSTVLATHQANFITEWFRHYRKGQRVLIATVTPRTTSTDLFLSNQTASGNEATRVAWNAWLRDGAPMVNNVAAAVGTNPAVRIGTSGHPVTACFDVADVSEPTRDAGVWKAPANSRTITDAAITSASNTLTSVTAAFTTADIGRAVWITGAGAAAAVLAVTIMKLNGGTSVTVNAAAGTTVSGGTATIADAYTMDGLHPHTYGSVQAATVINTALIT
jgi:hypothetical protein